MIFIPSSEASLVRDFSFLIVYNTEILEYNFAVNSAVNLL
jgi:hypothetical protein